MNTSILNRSKKVSFRIENDLLFCELDHLDCYLREDQVIFFLSKIEKITEGKPMPLIIDIRKFVGNFSPEAAKLFANSSISKKCISAQAFIICSLNGKLLINSYIRIFGEEANIKVFDQMESAISFGLQFPKQNHTCND